MRRFRANTDVAVWRLVDDEAVIVHSESSAYYGLNASATFIWQAIQNDGLGIPEITQRVTARFGARGDAVQAGIEAFLCGLASEGLVRETADAAAAPPAASEPDERVKPATYEPPVFERFGELEKLVLSGE